MRFERRYSIPGSPVSKQVEWRTVDCVIPDGKGGPPIFEQRGVTVPRQWSDGAANVLAQKYFRKAGVPVALQKSRPTPDTDLPEWLWPSLPDHHVTAPTCGENFAGQVFHRLAGCWTYWGWRERIVTEDEQARTFYDELYMMLARQVAAPNSPQWFNTGLHWAYGIEGTANGQWAVMENNSPSGYSVFPTTNAYERPQPHACFIQPVSDDLVNEGGIMDLVTREARLFKHGSGTGTNPSLVRSKDEKLSGGGTASGVISFLRISDRAAGSIKSGGTTRRAAKMWCLDLDHPEIEDFVDWKLHEEAKAAMIAVGSRVIRERSLDVAASTHARNDDDYSIDLAREAGVPEAMIDRAREGVLSDEIDLDWQSEALDTVSGQNANNSVRPTNRFMELSLDENAPWKLTSRTTGETVREVGAKDLWDRICLAAWACADPGLLFHDTINEWHTCLNDGPIRACNPCGEYQFLDDTACNLASLRLTAFLRQDGSFDFDAYEFAVRFWTVVLEISIHMASFPSREIALKSHLYRTIGLGYADLGGMLMRLAIPYDSDEGRGLAAGLTALMTGIAYRTSAEMADEIGAFPRYGANADTMRQVLRNHATAAWHTMGKKDCQYEGLSILPYISNTPQHGEGTLHSRIAVTWNEVLCAKHFRNAQVTLLAPTGTIGLVMDCDTTGVEPDFSLVKHKSLAGGGLMTIVNQAVPAALRKLGYTSDEIEVAAKIIQKYGELSSFIWRRPEDAAVFDCANPARDGGRSIAPMGHVLMVAAVQPFLSGAVSKTINLPRNATVDDVRHVYRESHRLGVKAVAVYRDGSKLTQPLQSVRSRDVNVTRLTFPGASADFDRGVREYPPWRRERGFTQKVKIGDQSVFLRVSEYPDGRPCEMFLELAHQGSTLRAMADLVAMAVSLGLQYGVPVREFVERFTHTKFEPAGVVEGHDRIKLVSSIGDYLGRELGITYLGEDSLGQVRPAIAVDTGEALVALDTRAVGIASGYSGDICDTCGNATMLRSGSCLRCDRCGSTTGCS